MLILGYLFHIKNIWKFLVIILFHFYKGKFWEDLNASKQINLQKFIPIVIFSEDSAKNWVLLGFFLCFIVHFLAVITDAFRRLHHLIHVYCS